MENPIKERRYGKFEIPYDWMINHPKIIFEIMSKCMIIKAEYLFYSNAIEYEAASNDFEKISLGEKMLKYGINIDSFVTKDADGVVTINYTFGNFTKNGYNYIDQHDDIGTNVIEEV